MGKSKNSRIRRSGNKRVAALVTRWATLVYIERMRLLWIRRCLKNQDFDGALAEVIRMMYEAEAVTKVLEK